MNILDVQSDLISFQTNSELTEISYKEYNACDLSYQTFFSEHLIKNIPCVIKSLNNEWNCKEWVIDNKPNFEYLIKKFGEALIPVANCGYRYYNAQKKEDQILKQYVDYWKTYIFKNYSSDLPCLYLKDWHFTRDYPEANIYRVPNVFASDWLNEYFTARKDIEDDYRFVYMGPKGSWTPFHADVFTSYSWSVNLCGKKRWILYPPGQEKCLADKYGNLAYDVESPVLKDKSTYKNYNKLETQLEIIQHPGEAIFVPSGWHHQVWNLDDTISINHNWVNGCNIDKMWTSLRNNLVAVKNEISDCKDMEDWSEHCQVMLNATYGLDYIQFYKFLSYIIGVRLEHLITNTQLKVYGEWLIGENHLKFDITQAKNVLLQLVSDNDFTKLSFFTEVEFDIRSLISNTHLILDRK